MDKRTALALSSWCCILWENIDVFRDEERRLLDSCSKPSSSAYALSFLHLAITVLANEEGGFEGNS
jgi:hypothetical protein